MDPRDAVRGGGGSDLMAPRGDVPWPAAMSPSPPAAVAAEGGAGDFDVDGEAGTGTCGWAVVSPTLRSLRPSMPMPRRSSDATPPPVPRSCPSTTGRVCVDCVDCAPPSGGGRLALRLPDAVPRLPRRVFDELAACTAAFTAAIRDAPGSPGCSPCTSISASLIAGGSPDAVSTPSSASKASTAMPGKASLGTNPMTSTTASVADTRQAGVAADDTAAAAAAGTPPRGCDPDGGTRSVSRNRACAAPRVVISCLCRWRAMAVWKGAPVPRPSKLWNWRIPPTRPL